MIKFSSLLKGRVLSVRRNEQGESLLGTLLGVLLLSVMTASFAGVVFASATSSGVAEELTSRVALANTASSDALSDLRAESKVVPSGWSAVAVPAGFNYAAVQNNAGGATGMKMYQWGQVTNGVVTVYTSLPRPKQTYDCTPVKGVDASLRAEFLRSCVVVTSSGRAGWCPGGAGTTPCNVPEPNPLNANRDWRSQVNAATLTSTSPATAPNPPANTSPVSPVPAPVSVTTSTVLTGTFATSDAPRQVRYVFRAVTGSGAAVGLTFTSNTGVVLGTVSVPANRSGYVSGVLNTSLPAGAVSVQVKSNRSLTLQNMVLYVGKE